MVYTLPMQLLFIHAAGLLYIVCSLLPEQQRRFITLGTGVGWLLHGAALASIVITPDYLRLGFAVMLSAALWMTVAAYWIENRNLSVDGLRRLVLPIAAIVIVLPAFFPGSEIPLAGKSPWFSWHVGLSTLAYGSLTIAAFHAVLMAMQESRLHALPTAESRRGWFSLAMDRLPAIYADAAQLQGARDGVIAALAIAEDRLGRLGRRSPAVAAALRWTVFRASGFYIAYQQQDDREVMRRLARIVSGMLDLPAQAAVERVRRPGPIRPRRCSTRRCSCPPRPAR